MQETFQPGNSGIPQLYHVLFISFHLQKDPNAVIQKLRVVGSYVSLSAAKTAAYRCLFDAGYEKEWFTKYEVHHDREDGKVVSAFAPDGTEFCVQILNSAFDEENKKEGGLWKYTVAENDERISPELYYVVQVKTHYEDEQNREINIEGTFLTYNAARELAKGVLLNPTDGIDRASFAEYDEAGPDERDCGFGANVVVHAVGANGENFLVSVVKSQTMESVRLAEAAMRIA